MSNVLIFAGRVVSILVIVVLTVQIWKTAEYFNTLPEKDKNKSLLAWDVLMLSVMLIVLAAKLAVMY